MPRPARRAAGYRPVDWRGSRTSRRISLHLSCTSGRRSCGAVGRLTERRPRGSRSVAPGRPGRRRESRPVHLRSLRIRGFKSFPDTLEISLEPGVAVIVGPNGSGKSNIADAIVWAAGSLTPSELRAEKPDDVLFAGGGDRKAAEHCEVELVFDNEDGTWPDLDFSEVSIARRLVRGAEGQYLVNRAAVRRTDLVEILADVGLGVGDALDRRAGQGRAGARVEAGGPARVRRGGRRAREVQAPTASRGAEARACRAPGRARARRRGGGAQAPAAARAAGDCGRARGEARARDRGARTRGSRSSISPTPVRGGRRPRSVATLQRSRSEARRAGSRGSSASGREPRRSSPTRPDDARPRSRPATGCRAASSGSSCARSRLPPCSSASARETPADGDQPDAAERRRTSRARGDRDGRGCPERRARAGRRWTSGPSSSVSAFARSNRRSPSRRAFRPRLARWPRTAPGSRSPRSTSSRAPSEPSPRRCALARRAVLADDPPSGSRSSSARAQPGSAA